MLVGEPAVSSSSGGGAVVLAVWQAASPRLVATTPPNRQKRNALRPSRPITIPLDAVGRPKRPINAARIGLPRRSAADSRQTLGPAIAARGAASAPALGRQQPLALGALARELAGAADRLGSLARAPLGRLLVMIAKLHLAEDAFALHLLLQRLERLVDIVVADEDLHAFSRSLCVIGHKTSSPQRSRGANRPVHSKRRAV